METKLMFSLPKCFRQAAIPRHHLVIYVKHGEAHSKKKCKETNLL